MQKRLPGAVILLATVLTSSASAIKTESFNSASSAAVHGWSAMGSGVSGQTAGWVGTDDAGGASGEAQFNVRRGSFLSYADSNLGMTINGSNGFTMSGNLNVAGLVGTPDLGFTPILGFFSSATEYLGIHFRGDFDELGSDVAWGLRFATTSDDIRVNSGGDTTREIVVGVPRMFSLSYDPLAGAFGTITAEVSGAGSPIVHSLSETNRDLLNGVSFNMAGMMKQGNSADSNGINIRFDDLTYTGVAVVPEPSSAVLMLGLLATGALGRRFRAQHTIQEL